jgi:hypothetical protein
VVGNDLYERSIYGWIPLSHRVGLGLGVIAAPSTFRTDSPMVGGLTTSVTIVVAAWESVSRREHAPDAE